MVEVPVEEVEVVVVAHVVNMVAIVVVAHQFSMEILPLIVVFSLKQLIPNNQKLFYPWW